MISVGLFRNATDFQTISAGTEIFKEGDPGDRMFAVRKGQIDILVHGKVVETVEEGGIFGEMALIDKGTRSASAVARTDSEIVPVDERRFTFLIQQTPQFALQVMKIVTERLRRADKSL